MNDTSNIILIVSLLINPILLSGFIIPQAQKLKDIKDKLIKYDLKVVDDVDGDKYMGI